MQAALNQINHDRGDLTSLQNILFRLSSITRQPPYAPSHLPKRQMPRLGYGELEKWGLSCTLEHELRSLKGNLAVIHNKINDRHSSSSEERNALTHAEQRVSALEGLNRTILNTIPITARPTAASAEKARRVFAVEELLEKILLECDFHQLIAAEQVNRTFAQAFKSSNKLRKLIGLQPAIGCSPFSPLDSSFFISCGCIVRFEHRHPDGYELSFDEIALSASFIDPNPFDEQNLPILGGRFRSMLICQPPVTQMRIRTDCCNEPSYWLRRLPGVPSPLQVGDQAPDREEEVDRFPVIVSETGITLGQILDETKELRTEHRYCPNAHQGLHRDDGTVNVGVRFETILKLSSEDPLLKERRQAQETLIKEEQERRAIDARIQAYIAAKQSARDNRRPIATLEEFEATARAENGGLSSYTSSY